MRKFISLFLIMAFLQVQASTPSQHAQQLSNAFDNLSYSLTVEWDQKDQEFYNKQKNTLETTMKNLQDKGMTNQEMLVVLADKMKSKKFVKEMNDLMAVIKANNLSKNEARKFIADNLSKRYAQGSNWNGTIILSGAGVLIVAAVLIAVLAVGGGRSSSGVGCYDEYYCYDYYDVLWGWVEDCSWDLVCY